ncbi:sulfatase-like hydrolase/transferase [Spirochaetota bacterium]
MKKKYIILIAAVCVIALAAWFLLFKKKEPNVILIVMDAVRPDHLSCYGYERETSPFIDSLAAKGIRFTQAVAPAGWTGESVPSILTGTYPPLHDIHAWKQKRNPHVSTVASLLKKRSYRSYFFTHHSPNRFLDITNGFDRVYVSSYSKENEEQLNERIVRYMESHVKKPFFMYIHYHGAHMPYKRVPEPYRSMYKNDGLCKKKGNTDIKREKPDPY